MVKELMGSELEAFLETQLVAVIFFSRPNDAECQKMEEYFDVMVVPDYSEKEIAVRKVDISKPENQEMVDNFRVKEVPDAVFYLGGRVLNFEAPNGAVVNRVIGFNDDVEQLVSDLVHEIAGMTEDEICDLEMEDPGASCGCGGSCDHDHSPH